MEIELETGLDMEPGAEAELAVMLLLKTANGVLMCNASCISPSLYSNSTTINLDLIFNYVTDDVDWLKLQTCLIISGSPISQKVRYITVSIGQRKGNLRFTNLIQDDDLAAIMSNSSDRAPVADQAEDDAWFPSPYSLFYKDGF